MNFAFYVSGSAARLRGVLAEAPPELLADTKLVVSDSSKNADLAEPLRRRGIRFVCTEYDQLAPARTARTEALSRLLLAEFLASRIDYCFCFGNHVLRGELLRTYAARIINFHPSLLPMFPGRNAIDQAVKAGAHLLGNTAHFIVDEVDAGPVIMQSVLPAADFHASGYDAVLDLQRPMLYQIHAWLKAGRLSVAGGRVQLAGVPAGAAAFFPAGESLGSTPARPR